MRKRSIAGSVWTTVAGSRRSRMLPARVSARRKRRSASRKRTEPPSDEISPPPEIGGHLLASDGWEIEPEQAIVGHGGVALSLHGKKDASTTNFHSITTTYATSATTSLDPARIKRVSCRALRGLEEYPSVSVRGLYESDESVIRRPLLKS